MILVDIDVPVMGKRYDFQIDENMQLGMVARQIRDMICLQEQCAFTGKDEDLMLCGPSGRRILPPERTAGDCGITTGMSLVLV